MVEQNDIEMAQIVRTGRPPRGALLDRTGSAASALCAVHCVLGGAAPGILAAAGVGFLMGDEAEWLLVAAALVLGATAARRGFRTHRSLHLVGMFAVAATVLLISRGLDQLQFAGLGTYLAVCGGVLMAAAHMINIRACRSCGIRPTEKTPPAPAK